MIVNFGMRLYRRQNGVWYVGLPGNKRQSLRTRDKQVAQRLYRRLKREALLGNVRQLERQQRCNLKDFVNQYIEFSAAHKKESTSKRDEYSLNKVLQWIGNKPLHTITAKMIDDFHADLINSGHKKSGVAITFRHNRAAFNQAVKWGYLKNSPFETAKRIQVEKRPPRFYSEKELKKIFEAISKSKDFHELITCYLLTGMRRSELFYLSIRNIDFKNNLITIAKTKTTWRTIPLESPVREILQSRCKTAGIGRLWPKWKHPNAVTHRWIRLMKRLGMKGRLYDLRHSFASHLAMAGEHIRTIQNWLGHSDLSTTMIYTHLSPDHMRQSVARLENLHKISTGQYPKKITIKNNK
jgi:integrase